MKAPKDRVATPEHRVDGRNPKAAFLEGNHETHPFVSPTANTRVCLLQAPRNHVTVHALAEGRLSPGPFEQTSHGQELSRSDPLPTPNSW